MNDDIPDTIKFAIIRQELEGIQQQLYRMSVSCEARKIAGYTEEENKPMVNEIERLVKLRDAFGAKLEEIGAPG
jgi:hypothetical protein